MLSGLKQLPISPTLWHAAGTRALFCAGAVGSGAAPEQPAAAAPGVTRRGASARARIPPPAAAACPHAGHPRCSDQTGDVHSSLPGERLLPATTKPRWCGQRLGAPEPVPPRGGSSSRPTFKDATRRPAAPGILSRCTYHVTRGTAALSHPCRRRHGAARRGAACVHAASEQAQRALQGHQGLKRRFGPPGSSNSTPVTIKPSAITAGTRVVALRPGNPRHGPAKAANPPGGVGGGAVRHGQLGHRAGRRRWVAAAGARGAPPERAAAPVNASGPRRPCRAQAGLLGGRAGCALRHAR